jgi:hypothetical protein
VRAGGRAAAQELARSAARKGRACRQHGCKGGRGREAPGWRAHFITEKRVSPCSTGKFYQRACFARGASRQASPSSQVGKHMPSPLLQVDTGVADTQPAAAAARRSAPEQASVRAKRALRLDSRFCARSAPRGRPMAERSSITASESRHSIFGVNRPAPLSERRTAWPIQVKNRSGDRNPENFPEGLVSLLRPVSAGEGGGEPSPAKHSHAIFRFPLRARSRTRNASQLALQQHIRLLAPAESLLSSLFFFFIPTHHPPLLPLFCFLSFS